MRRSNKETKIGGSRREREVGRGGKRYRQRKENGGVVSGSDVMVCEE